MLIPKSMKKMMAKKFYDKLIHIISAAIEHDEEGGIEYGEPIITGSFFGNVNYSNFGKIQEEYGLDYKIDITITASPDTSIRVNDTILYDGKYYTIRDVFARDSHKMIVATIYNIF